MIITNKPAHVVMRQVVDLRFLVISILSALHFLVNNLLSVKIKICGDFLPISITVN